MVVDFAKRIDFAVVSTYFNKKDEHRVTYKSGEKSTQVDYVMCRRRDLMTSDAQPFISKAFFIELMKSATSGVEFSFNDIMYKQTDGVAMGSPLGPALVNIFVRFYEEKLFSQISKPSTYFRYVDDTFAIFRNEEESENFFNQLNCLHPSLKFTFEKEKNSCLLFLDVNVERTVTGFETNVYRKPTFTGQYLR